MLILLLPQINLLGKDENSYFSVQSHFNFAHIPNYYNHKGYTRWGEEYNKYYNNHVSASILYISGNESFKFQNGFSFESFSFSSDTAIGNVNCSIGVEEQQFTKYGNGNYLCLYSGFEIFPFKRFSFFSFGSGVTLGYSGKARSYDDVISGCFISTQSTKIVEFDRKFFIGISTNINIYISLSHKIDLITSVRYQFRLNKLNHSVFGVGLGLKYKF